MSEPNTSVQTNSTHVTNIFEDVNSQTMPIFADCGGDVLPLGWPTQPPPSRHLYCQRSGYGRGQHDITVKCCDSFSVNGAPTEDDTIFKAAYAGTPKDIYLENHCACQYMLPNTTYNSAASANFLFIGYPQFPPAPEFPNGTAPQDYAQPPAIAPFQGNLTGC